MSLAIPSISGTTAMVVPSEPTGVSVSNWHGYAHVTWQEPNQTSPGITHYLVYRSVNGSGSSLITQLNESARQYRELMPSFAVNLTYCIVAENSVGTGKASSNVTLIPIEFPAMPTGLRTASGAAVRPAWRVDRVKCPDHDTDVPNTSIHDDQVSASSTYFYNVKVVTNVSESAWSDSVTITSPAKNINDNSALVSVFALVLAVVAFQIAFVAIHVVISSSPEHPEPGRTVSILQGAFISVNPSSDANVH